MNVPGGGKNDIPNRLKRQFAIFNVPQPSSAAINMIFGALVQVMSCLASLDRDGCPAQLASQRTGMHATEKQRCCCHAMSKPFMRYARIADRGLSGRAALMRRCADQRSWQWRGGW